MSPTPSKTAAAPQSAPAAPAPGDVQAPDVPVAQQNDPDPAAAKEPASAPAAPQADLDALKRTAKSVKVKSFVGASAAPSDLYLVLDEKGDHYFASEVPDGTGAQLLAIKGQKVDDGVSARLAQLFG